MDAVDNEKLILKVLKDYKDMLPADEIIKRNKLFEISRNPRGLLYSWTKQAGVKRNIRSIMNVDWNRIREKAKELK